MTPKEIVLRQIEEYNNQDIEKCLAYCNPAIEVLLLPNSEQLFKGREVLEGHLKSSFGTEKLEKVEVLEAIELGPFVTTVEKKINVSTRNSRSLLVTYYVENSLIKIMWAARGE